MSIVSRPHLALSLLAHAALCVNVAARGESKWEITPYRVSLAVAADRGDLSTDEQAQLEQRLVEQAAAHIGSGWQLSLAAPSAALRAEMRVRLDELTAEQLLALDPAASVCDKRVLVVLSRSGSDDVVAVRELDVTTRQLGPRITRRTASRRLLAGTVLDAICAAFAPLVELDRATGNSIVGRIRAAALVDDPHAPLVVSPGTPLLPVLRIDDRLGRTTPDQVSALPLTILNVVAREQGIVQCEIHCAGRHRLAARASLRLSRLGLAVRTTEHSTRIVLQAAGSSAAPLVDYDLVEPGARPGQVQRVARTNAQGVAVIAADARPWRLLYVRQGEHLLARLPLVTGQQREILVSLPSNDVRLRAEGFVAALRQAVIDTVARRQILAARLRQRIAAGQMDEAQRVLEELQRLPTSRQFTERLQAARTQLVADNARAQQHIEELLRDTQVSLTQYLDPSEIDRLETQLTQARGVR